MIRSTSWIVLVTVAAGIVAWVGCGSPAPSASTQSGKPVLTLRGAAQ